MPRKPAPRRTPVGKKIKKVRTQKKLTLDQIANDTGCSIDHLKRIITERAMHYIANPNPEHRYLAGDYFDVDHELFGRTKRLMIRIARLSDAQVSTSAWVPVPGQPKVTVAVHNGVRHRYYGFGQESVETPPEMQEAFGTGRLVSVGPEPGKALATVLAPVRDSLGEVAAVVELTAPLEGEPPAWS